MQGQFGTTSAISPSTKRRSFVQHARFGPGFNCRLDMFRSILAHPQKRCRTSIQGASFLVSLLSVLGHTVGVCVTAGLVGTVAECRDVRGRRETGMPWDGVRRAWCFGYTWDGFWKGVDAADWLGRRVWQAADPHTGRGGRRRGTRIWKFLALSSRDSSRFREMEHMRSSSLQVTFRRPWA